MEEPSTDPAARGRQRWLMWAVYRHWRGVGHAVQALLPRPPRPRLKALLMLAMAELREVEDDPSRRGPTIHHAVAMAKLHLSAGEAGLVNAVLRKFADQPRPTNDPALATSHPVWLAQRWENRWGRATANTLMEWNQRPAPVYLHLANLPEATQTPGTPTSWANFLELSPPDWEAALALIAGGRAYIQDPASRHPPHLANVQSGETVLDLCASPGGKSWCLAHAMKGKGTLCCVDLPGPRQARLRENCQRLGGVFPDLNLSIVAADVLSATPAEFKTTLWDCVMVDAPCSNTGVLRRKPDVRIRLSPDDLYPLAALQGQLLDAAARRVRSGGRLVYSTCSLEEEENEQVVAAFLERMPGFRLQDQKLSYPWLDQHDGGGAFLLTHSG